jgi:uncharacterized membrane protein (DUF106 family)
VSTPSTHYCTISDMNNIKHEIENIKKHYAPMADMIKWTVGVGIATVLSITGITTGLFLNWDTKITDLRKEIKEDVREVRLEMKEMRMEIRQEMGEMRQEIKEMRQDLHQVVAALSKK